MFPTLVGDGTDVKKGMADMLVGLYSIHDSFHSLFALYKYKDFLHHINIYVGEANVHTLFSSYKEVFLRN